jgi:hypothetical protein
MMLDEHKIPSKYWAEAVNTSCHVLNCIFLHAFKKKTSYELIRGQIPKVSHFRVFCCKYFIVKEGKLDKFETRSSDGIFLGYAIHSRAFPVLNHKINQIQETYEVTFDETQPCSSIVFECAGDDELGQTIFENEEDEE